MSTTSERRRAYSGPVLLSHGFRPFFLSAGAWAVLAMLIWLTFLVTGQSIPSQFTGVEWHMHEMIFGYPLAVIAGFLLTAVPNWTGRMPIMGWPVAGLVGLWIAGRVTILFSEFLHPIIPPIVDLGFFLIFAIIIAREILAGKNWRNLKVLGLLIVLGLGNVIFYIEASTTTAVGGYGIRIGTGTIIFLIILIGGRVIPSFTRNWLARQKPGRLPAPVNRFDTIAIFVAALAIVLWVVAPETWLVRILSLAAGLLHILRLARWVGWRTLAEPLTTILHIGYLFIPLGFLILALGDLHPVWSGSPQIPHGATDVDLFL